MSYLSDAIQQLERSFGDAGSADFRDSMRTMAIASALVSIAQSLDKISDNLETLNKIPKHDIEF